MSLFELKPTKRVKIGLVTRYEKGDKRDELTQKQPLTRAQDKQVDGKKVRCSETVEKPHIEIVEVDCGR